MAKSCLASSPLSASSIMRPIFLRCRPLVQRVWRLWIYLLLGCIFQAPALAMNPPTELADQGFLEDIHFDASHRQMTVKGWSASGRSNAFPTLATIYLDNHVVYKGRLNSLAYPRPDVAQATKNPSWANTGFHIRFFLDPDFPSGTYAVKIDITTTDGHQFPLLLQDQTRQITLNQSARSSRIARAIFLLAFSLPVFFFLISFKAGFSPRIKSLKTFGLSIALAFFILVAGGWTGSSISLLFSGNDLVEHDEKSSLGSSQIIRSDEWHVITAMAISQFNAAATDGIPRKFENISTVFSIAGHNMNTVGMSGVPVSNPSALARPATWGFFFLDLRSALAWYWWFPFFGCFCTCLWVLASIFSLRWQAAAVIALTISASPVSVGWSGWPAYVLFFAILAFGMFLTAWTQRSIWQIIARSSIAGWAIAGFVLTLYPAWMIVVATLLLPLAVAWLSMQRMQWIWSYRQAVLLLCTGIVCSLLMLSWWSHTADAVSAITSTIYPGKRAETGGYMDPWYLVRGLYGPDQMFHITDMSVPSDAGSYIFLFIPLFVLFGWQQIIHIKKHGIHQLDWTGVVCLLFTTWVICFSYFGIMPWVAQITQWSKVPVYRTDIGLLLAQSIMLALVIRCYWTQKVDNSRPTVPKNQYSVLMGVVSAAACIWLALFSLAKLPAAISETITPAFAIIAISAYAILAYLILNQKFISALAIYSIWTLGTSLPFNPVSQAPNQVKPSQLLNKIESLTTTQQERWVILDEHRISIGLAASGIKIGSGIFYHPPFSLWEKLDPQKIYFNTYNRYQHLTIEGTELKEGDFEPVLHSLDHVLLKIDTRRFDFGKMGVTHIAAPRRHDAQLMQNPHLQHLKTEGNWCFYRTVR